MFVRIDHGQTLADRTSLGPSFQLYKWLHAQHALTASLAMQLNLIVENSAQTTSRFSPVSYRAPQIDYKSLQWTNTIAYYKSS